MTTQSTTTTTSATFERWAGLIDLALIFAAVASWTVPIVGLVLLVLLLRRWSFLGYGVCLLLRIQAAPLALRFLLPSTTTYRAAEITSSNSAPADPKIAIAEPFVGPSETTLHSIAKPNNDSNEALRVAAENAAIATLAALIMESKRKPYQNGVVPETRAMGAVFGVKPSSDPTSEYQRLRSLLHAKLGEAGPEGKDEIVSVSKAGRTIRKATDGTLYYIDEQGVKHEIEA